MDYCKCNDLNTSYFDELNTQKTTIRVNAPHGFAISIPTVNTELSLYIKSLNDNKMFSHFSLKPGDKISYLNIQYPGNYELRGIFGGDNSSKVLISVHEM